MVRKVKAVARTAHAAAGDKQLPAALRDSATQIWVAGMGAFARVQQEGNKVLDALVHDTAQFQQRALKAGQETAKQVEEKINRVAIEVEGRLSRVASQVQKRASVARDQIEVAIEERLQGALGRLGSRPATVDQLAKKVDELSAAVHKLAGAKPAAKRARKTAAAA
jgi:poly(hydroxyalkanoate) granule-associated protein